MSPTWLCGDGRPTAAQADLFALARETVERNIELFRPGMSLREITEKLCYAPVEDYHGYTVLAHGVGLCDEYPSVFTREKWDSVGFDDTIEAGFVISVVRDDGPELQTHCPVSLT